MSRRSKSSDQNVCCFCGSSEDNEVEFGKFYRHGNIVTHYYCLLLSSNMEQKGQDNQGILGFLESDIQKELRRGKRLVCSYCKKAGATLGCCNVRCKQIFHYPCGLRAGTLNQFFGEFRSFCVKHRPKQKIDIEVKNELAQDSETVCYICYDSVNPCDAVSTIWAPCCKKNAWFHRKCVQQLAVSAGYFFKCPLCNDKKSFQQAMLQFGIFIPCQDASWELVPNAFEELLYRHDQCDAPICLCPKGRKYTSLNAKWELTLCRTCGSQGIHMACGHLKWANPTWECSECTTILHKSKDCTSSNITTLQNGSDSEDSDSDISVGKDSPVPFTSVTSPLSTTPDISSIKLRPGPRTYKLKQLRSVKETQKYATSELSHIEESTSKEDTSVSTLGSSSITNRVSHNYEEYTNPLPKHSKSSPTASVSTDITFNSDDDIIEVSTKSSLNSTIIIASANKAETNDVSQSENTNKDKKNNSSPFKTRKLWDTDNFRENVNDNSLTSNSNITENNFLEELSSQDAEKSNILEEVDLRQEEANYACSDFLSNIKITNVVSLAPEEFENAPSCKEVQEVTDIKYLASESSNDALNNSSPSQPLFAQSVTLDSSLKRKSDIATLTLITSPVDTLKKMKRNINVHEEGQQSLFSSIDPNNTMDYVTPVNSTTTLILNKNDVQAHNNNHASSFNSNNDTVSIIPSSYNMKFKQKDDNNITYGTNERNEILKNINTEPYTTNCDGDAGTSPAAQSGNRSKIGTEEHCNYSHSTPNRSQKLDKRREIRMATNSTFGTTNNVSSSVLHQRKSGTESHHSRLISKYVRLHDLKFRICNSNNLQMILYDKFLVNINMENTVAMKDTRFDTSTRDTVQQKFFKAQNESASSFKSENIIHSTSAMSHKDKERYSLHVVNQSDNFRDDAKENLDPVTTISYKNVADSLPTNTALIMNNLTVSTNSTNQHEVGNSTQSMYNIPNVIDDRLCSGESVNRVNAENIFNSETTASTMPRAAMNSNSGHLESNNDAVQDIPNLNSAHTTSNMIEKYNVKLITNDDSLDLTKLCQQHSYSEDHMYCKTENDSTSETDCKVSIDLKKLENFIDDNPNLFLKVKKEDDERYFNTEKNNLSNRLVNSATDKSKGFGNFTLSLSKDKMIELRNRMNKNTENIKELMVTDNLVQDRYINNSLSHNQVYDLKHTSGHFEKQSICNR